VNRYGNGDSAVGFFEAWQGKRMNGDCQKAWISR
jgi:hypothetical protein